MDASGVDECNFQKPCPKGKFCDVHECRNCVKANRGCNFIGRSQNDQFLRTKSSDESWPKWMQHRATFLHATCCVRLANPPQHVATWSNMLHPFGQCLTLPLTSKYHSSAASRTAKEAIGISESRENWVKAPFSLRVTWSIEAKYRFSLLLFSSVNWPAEASVLILNFQIARAFTQITWLWLTFNNPPKSNNFNPFHSQVQKVHSPNLLKRNSISAAVRIGSRVIRHLCCEKSISSYCVMLYFWRGCRRNLTLITLDRHVLWRNRLQIWKMRKGCKAGGAWNLLWQIFRLSRKWGVLRSGNKRKPSDVRLQTDAG